MTHRDGDLAQGSSLGEGADRLYALPRHDTYWLLVTRRGWAQTRWRRDVGTPALRQLLPQ